MNNSTENKRKTTANGASESTRVVEKDPVKFSAEMIKRDGRLSDIVEVNLKDTSARIVKSSKAPKITKKVLKEKGAPIQTGKSVIEGANVEVDMHHGVSLALNLERQIVIDKYKDNYLKDLETFTERERAVKRLVLSRLIPDTFSYEGKPEGLPAIEACSDTLLEGLWEAYLDLHFPIEDDIYQVKVLREIPEPVRATLSDTYEMYPVVENIDADAITNDELERFLIHHETQRSVLVSNMILDPCLSYKGEGKSKHPYPTEDLSEWMMQCFTNAYSTSNTVMGVLRRFLQQREAHGWHPDLKE